MPVPKPRALPLWLAVLCVVLVSPPARAGDPSLRWRTIVTPHFYIHYYRSARHDERELAHRLAAAAELAHERLTKVLKNVPQSRRVDLVLTDDTDGANGSAQNIPMDIVRLNAVGPTSLSALNDHDEWLYALVLHEYTHILHIDTVHGLAKLVNWVLGKTWTPNMVQPKWFIEGLAVYYESARSSGGRLRNSVFDMYLRMPILEGKLLELDQISSYTRIWPRGNVPYLYGSRFVKYLCDRFGEEKVTEISHRYGGTVIPYAINRIAREVLGHTYVELYGDFKRHLKRHFELQRDGAASRGLTAFRKVTDHGETSNTPVFSRDGRELAYIDSDGHSQSSIKVVDPTSGRVVQQLEHFGGSGLDFTPDRRHMVYGGASKWQSFYDYDDLFVWDRESGRRRRLTYGMRARDPAVSPDGRTVAFVTTDLGNMDLRVMPFQGGAAEVLYKGRDGDEVYSPHWSPDGKLLAYSRWSRGGDRDLYVMEVETRRTRRLMADRAIDTDPVFSPDGKRLYFSSDRTGIYNIYCYELETGELRQVTNVLGGAFSPAVSPDEKEVYYVGFSSKGYDLHAMRLQRDRFLPALPYVNTRPAPVKIAPPAQPFPERPYSAWRTLYPHAWMLTFGSDSFGPALGVQLNGEDVAGLHRWNLITSIGTARGTVSYGLGYGYYRFWPSFDLDHSRTVGVRGGLVENGVRKNYTEENYAAGLAIGLPVLRIPEHMVNLAVGYRFNWLHNTDEHRIIVEPDMITPVLPRTGILSGVTASIAYSNIQRYAWSVSNEKGRYLNFAIRFDHPALGSDYQTATFNWGWTEYVKLPWLHEHVLALRYSGGVGTGDVTRRGLFFIGGFPEQDVLRAFFDPSSRVGGAFLRGYPPGVVYGDQYHLLNVEYRMPLFNIERGFSSLPLYFTHVHAAAFVDTGNAFFGEASLGDTKVGVGAELMLEMVIGYIMGSTFRVGYARGLMDKGGNEFHFLIGSSF